MKFHSILKTDKKKKQQQHIEHEIDSKWNTICLHLQQKRMEPNQMYSEKKRKHFTISSARHNKSIEISIFSIHFGVFTSYICVYRLYWIKSHFLFTQTHTHSKKRAIMEHFVQSISSAIIQCKHVYVRRVCLCHSANAHSNTPMRASECLLNVDKTSQEQLNRRKKKTVCTHSANIVRHIITYTLSQSVVCLLGVCSFAYIFLG